METLKGILKSILFFVWAYIVFKMMVSTDPGVNGYVRIVGFLVLIVAPFKWKDWTGGNKS